MVNIKPLDYCSLWKLTVLSWCCNTPTEEKEYFDMSTIMCPEVWLLTNKFSAIHIILFTQSSYNFYYNFSTYTLKHVQIKFQVDFICSNIAIIDLLNCNLWCMVWYCVSHCFILEGWKTKEYGQISMADCGYSMKCRTI